MTYSRRSTQNCKNNASRASPLFFSGNIFFARVTLRSARQTRRCASVNMAAPYTNDQDTSSFLTKRSSTVANRSHGVPTSATAKTACIYGPILAMRELLLSSRDHNLHIGGSRMPLIAAHQTAGAHTRRTSCAAADRASKRTRRPQRNLSKKKTCIFLRSLLRRGSELKSGKRHTVPGARGKLPPS